MTDLAVLGLRIESQEAEAAQARLDGLSAAAGRADAATGALASESAVASSAIRDLLASIDKTVRQMLEIAKSHRGAAAAATDQASATATLSSELEVASTSHMKFGMSARLAQSGMGGAAAAARDFATAVDQADSHVVAYRQHMAALASTHEAYDAHVVLFQSHMAGLASKTLPVVRAGFGLTAHEGLNMARQFTDIGVTAAMGMNPLLIAIQQGPQLLDVFQMAAIRTGATVTSVMRQAAAAAWAAVAPFAPLIIAVGAVAGAIGGTLALATRALNKDFGDLTQGMGLTEKQLERVQNKGVTMGDVLAGTLNYVRDVIWNVIGPSVTKIGEWFSQAMDVAGRAIVNGAKLIVGTFLGAFRAVRATWTQLPGVMGDVVMSAVNAVIAGIEWMVNKAIDGINALVDAAKKASPLSPVGAVANLIPRIEAIRLGRASNPYAGEAHSAGVVLGEQFGGGFIEGANIVDRQIAALSASIKKAGEDRIRAEAGAPEQARERVTGTGPRAANDNEKVIELQPMRDSLALLRMERDLIGASNVERAVKLAQLAKEQELQRQGFTAASDGYAEAIQLAGDLARSQEEVVQAQAAWTYDLEYGLDLMRQIDDQARGLSRGLSDAFGAPGRALGDLLTGMTGLQTRLSELTEAERRYRLEVGETGVDQQQIALFARKRADAEVQAYGDMIGAARGFFKEGSDGYRVLTAAEQAYRLVQFALSAQAMIMGGQETAFTIGQNAIRAVSHGVVAVARALASLPFPLNLAAGAATVAALAAIGVRLGGGGGGGRGGGGTYNPAPINDGSVARSQAASASAPARQDVVVRVVPNDDRFDAYVDARTQPYTNAASQASVRASRTATKADRQRDERFTMGRRAG